MRFGLRTTDRSSWLCAILAVTLVVHLRAQNAPAQNPSADVKDRDLAIHKLAPAKNVANSVPRGYALLIGISKYKNLDPAENLRFPESDAQGIYQVLISKEAGALPPENVHVLTGPQATRENIRHELEDWLPSVAHEDDTVIVFFAGHGFSAAGRGYFAAWDVDPDHLTETGYSMADFGRTLQTKVKARNKVLLVDACRSAKVTRGQSDAADPQEAVNAEIGKMPPSFLTFVAAREQDRSYEDPALGSGAGLFSYFVIQGLKGEADQNPCDGVVTADELIEYVRTQVRQYARERGRSQTPTDYGDFDPNIVLALSHKCGGTVAHEDVQSGNLVIEANMDDVEVFLDNQRVGSASKSTPLRLPGIAAGIHTITGAHKGYETDTKEVPVVPGQEKTVTIRIQYPREYKKQSRTYMEEGEKLLFSQRSSFNPLSVYAPRSQTQKSFEEAQSLFRKAVVDDPKDARAFYDLGLTLLYLNRWPESVAALRGATEMDPTYVEAKMQYAGELIESGDPDEAIRQLTDIIALEPKNNDAFAYLSRAYYDKFVYDNSVAAADQALALNSKSDQAYLWKGAALREMAAHDRDPTRKLALYKQSTDCFLSFLALTNFSSPIYQQLPFYLVGFGLGQRTHADRADSYKLQRSIAFEGLCDAENKLGQSQRAEKYCQEAIRLDDKDPVAFYLLGHVYRDRFAADKQKDELQLARQSYQQVVILNPDLDISKNARNYLDQIQALLEIMNAPKQPH
ncbi:MAG: caspase family protein [Acidobacteriaceae bacterium]|nr:caspase family protein [Acidobacteriaceae bacterium]